MFGCFNTEREYLDFLSFLEQLCSPACHSAVIGTSPKIRIQYSTLNCTFGILDVFRYQAEQNWDTKENYYSAQIGQGMFQYEGNKIIVNDRADLGWKYYLPDPTPIFCNSERPEVMPKLTDLIVAVRTSKNISSEYLWEGP